VAGGTTAAARKVLDAVLGDAAVRELAVRARAALFDRVRDLFDAEEERYQQLLAGWRPPGPHGAPFSTGTGEQLVAGLRGLAGTRSGDPAQRLRDTSVRLRLAAEEAALTRAIAPALAALEFGDLDEVSPDTYDASDGDRPDRDSTTDIRAGVGTLTDKTGDTGRGDTTTPGGDARDDDTGAGDEPGPTVVDATAEFAPQARTEAPEPVAPTGGRPT
jgi:hypothetical protein